MFTTSEKSLNEQIKDICEGKGSKTTKRAALVKLGIMPNEAATLVAMYATETGAKKAVYTFGVELECNVNYNRVIRENGNMFKYMGYTHTNSREVFKFVTDSSLRNTSSDALASAIECVSPVMKSSSFTTLKKAVEALNEGGAVVNRTCGFHVHVGAEGLDETQWVNVFKNYYYLQVVIDTFMARSRRGNASHWCAALRPSIKDCNTREQVRRVCSSRYCKVNAFTYQHGHNTIEFRQHAGTTNYKKIEMWTKFCIALVDWSKTNVLSETINSIDEIPFLTKAQKTYFKARQSELA